MVKINLLRISGLGLAVFLLLGGGCTRTVRVPETQRREVTRYRLENKQVEVPCEKERWVSGEVEIESCRRIAVYPFEVHDFSLDLAHYWVGVTQDWLTGTGQFEITAHAELQGVLAAQNLGRGEPLDPEALTRLQRRFGLQAILHGTINGARGGPRWNVDLMDSASGSRLARATGSGDLADQVAEVLTPMFGHREIYIEPCMETVTNKIPYRVVEDVVVYREETTRQKPNTAWMTVGGLIGVALILIASG